jgi:hypothetical protein
MKSVGYWYETALAPMQNINVTTEALDKDGWEVIGITSTNMVAVAQSQIIDPNKPPQGVPVFMVLARKIRFAGQKRPGLPNAQQVPGIGAPVDPKKVNGSK